MTFDHLSGFLVVLNENEYQDPYSTNKRDFFYLETRNLNLVKIDQKRKLRDGKFIDNGKLVDQFSNKEKYTFYPVYAPDDKSKARIKKTYQMAHQQQELALFAKEVGILEEKDSNSKELSLFESGWSLINALTYDEGKIVFPIINYR